MLKYAYEPHQQTPPETYTAAADPAQTPHRNRPKHTGTTLEPRRSGP